MSTVTRTTMAILVVAAIAPVAPAAGQIGAPANGDRGGSAEPGASGEPAELRRDGDRAVPFDPVIDAHEAPALRRDGSQAVPFAAAVGARGGIAEDGFDWGDAGIGAAGAIGLMLLASAARAAGRRRRPSEPRQTVVA